MLRLIYDDTDITDMVGIRECVYKDQSGRSDTLELCLEDAEKWMRWRPKADDRLKATLDGNSTGTMYLSAIFPEQGKYRILLSAVPSIARNAKWASYHNKTLGNILQECAADCGMNAGVYGVDPDIMYTYMEQRNEGSAGFIHRLGRMECAILKCANGQMNLVGIGAAQRQNPKRTVDLAPRHVTYIREEGNMCGKLTLTNGLIQGQAVDWRMSNGTITTGRGGCIINNVPARENLTAERWAVGLLMDNNRKWETLKYTSDYDSSCTATARMDVTGGEEYTGAWIVDTAVHDLKNRKTTALLMKVVDSVGAWRGSDGNTL